ncbi:DUF874 family protein [Helicobacter pylori]|nr:DUF874 family protein [Helicobacter pylori]
MTHAACKKAKELDDKVQDKSKQAEKENQINWWKYSGLTIAASLLLAACSVGDVNEQIELEQERQKTNKSGIELEQEKQEAENARDRANKSGVELEQERQKTIKEQKDFIKYVEQNCQENHGQFFIKKGGLKAGITIGIAIEVEAECKTPKPTKTNQTPIQPKHLPNSKQPRSQRGSKAQELIAYLQKELESLPYSQKAIAKQVDFYKPSSIAYLELDPRDFNATEECVKNSPHLANKERLCQKEVHEKFSDPYSNSKELSVKSAISFCIKKVDAKLEKAALMNGVFISPYKKSTHCQRTHLDNKSLKEIALEMNPKLEKQSPFIDANKLAMQSAGLLRKNKGVLIAFAADICMERNEHKKEEFISLKESCAQSQAKIYNNKERFDKFIQDYQKDLKTCLLDTSNTKEEMEQNISQCQKEQLRDDNKGFTLEELVKKYAK